MMTAIAFLLGVVVGIVAGLYLLVAMQWEMNITFTRRERLQPAAKADAGNGGKP